MKQCTLIVVYSENIYKVVLLANVKALHEVNNEARYFYDHENVHAKYKVMHLYIFIRNIY